MDRYGTVTLEEVNAAIRKHIDFEKFAIVRVGDFSENSTGDLVEVEERENAGRSR